MSFFKLVWKSLMQHKLSTGVTVFSLALAAGLMLTVWVLQAQSRQVFAQSNSGFDAVLGARGSSLQLVLNSIYHLEQSPGNMDWQDYLDIARDPRISRAIPIAVGDNLYGFRIVGTTTNIFAQVNQPDSAGFHVAEGRPFQANRREAVLGSFVASQLSGFKVGSLFRPYHGLRFDPSEQHDEEYVITGILKPTNSPADRAVWIPLEGVQHMVGHAASEKDRISAVLLKLTSPTVGQMLNIQYNRQGNRLTFAFPVAAIVSELFKKVSWLDRLLQGIAMLVGVVAAASVLASVYNSMNERRRDIAIMRALGVRKLTIFGLILWECALIGLLGSLLGFAVYAGLMAFGSAILREKTGIVLSLFFWHGAILWTPVLMTGASLLAGIVPAWKAYSNPVAENLVPLA